MQSAKLPSITETVPLMTDNTWAENFLVASAALRLARRTRPEPVLRQLHHKPGGIAHKRRANRRVHFLFLSLRHPFRCTEVDA